MLVAFSMKTSRACACMQSYGNDAFKFSKTEENNNTNSTCIKCTIVPGLVELVLFSKPITKTRQCNIQQYFRAVKMFIFR